MIYLRRMVLEGRQSPESVRVSEADCARVAYIFLFSLLYPLLWS